MRVRSPPGALFLPASEYYYCSTMTKTKPEKPTKPGPEPERLVIDEDPAEALSKLLKKPPTPTKNDD